MSKAAGGHDEGGKRPSSGHSHNLDAGRGMLAAGTLPKMPKAMIRRHFLLAFAGSMLVLAGTLWAGAARAQMSDSDLVTRIDHLEAQVRDLTGTIEQLQYRNQQLEQQLQQAQAAAPNAAQARPTPQYAPPPQAQQYPAPPPGGPQYSQAPTAQYSPPPGQYSPPPGQYSPQPPQAQYSPPPPQYTPPPPATTSAVVSAAPNDTGSYPPHRGDAFDPSRDPNAPGAPRALGAPGVAAAEPPPAVSDTSAPRQVGAPLDLSSGTNDVGQGGPSQGGPSQGGPLPPPPLINPNSTGAMQAALPPGNTPKDEFDLGYGYVLHKDYGLAEQTFHDFLQKYPSDHLTPEAQYWLGEALFQDKHYRDAAESFLAVSTKDETTARAPDALMRLGQSLAALGEKEAACASLGEVLRKYPKASPAVKQNVDREQKRVHC
jgi:tol-pal system protein YbgF